MYHLSLSLSLSKMAATILSMAKTVGLSRPFFAMISLSKSPCVKTLNLSHRRFHADLSLSTKTLNLSHRSVPPPCVWNLRSYSSMPKSDWTKVNEQLDKFDKENMKRSWMTDELRKEYGMKLEKLFEEAKDDEVEDYLLTDVEDLQEFIMNIIHKRLKAEGATERANEVLDWFDNEMLKAKVITEKLRKDLDIMILKANKNDNNNNNNNNDHQDQDLEELEEMYLTLFHTHEKAIRAKAAPEPKDNNKPRYLKWKPVSSWKADQFIVELNELVDWFEKETTEANDTTKKLRKEYDTIIAKLSAEEREQDDDDDEPGKVNSWRRCFKELEKMSWNLKKKQLKAILAKAKANKLAQEEAMVAKLLYPLFSLSPSLGRVKKLKSDDSMNELLDWFDKETMEANDTYKKLRKEYETIIAKLLAEDRAVLVEDVEDLQDFYWELYIKYAQARDLIFNSSPCYHSKSFTDVRRKTEITESDWIMHVWETHMVGIQFRMFEEGMMKVKENTEKLRKDHEMIAQKLLLWANDDEEEEDKTVLVKELDEMYFNLSENKAKAIQAKAKAAKALDHKTKAAELLSCFFVF